MVGSACVCVCARACVRVCVCGLFRFASTKKVSICFLNKWCGYPLDKPRRLGEAYPMGTHTICTTTYVSVEI